MLSSITGNWRTSVSGLCIMGLALLNAISLMVDNQPTTNPDWNMTMTQIITGIGLLLAHDNVLPRGGVVPTEPTKKS